MNAQKPHADTHASGTRQCSDPARILAAIERIDSAIQITSDVKVVLDNIIAEVFQIFQSDRAWLFFPCNPDLSSFEVAFESTTPAYPGAKALSEIVPMTADMTDYCNRALAKVGEPEIDPPVGQEMTNDIAIRFQVQSLMFMALQPQVGDAWMFGLHQCDHKRDWTADDQLLFKMIGHRLTNCIGNMLYLDRLRLSEETHRYAMEATKDGMWDWDIESGHFYYSPAWVKILGEKDLSPSNKTWVQRIHPQDRQHVIGSMQDHLQGKSANWQAEHRLRTKTGDWKWILGRGQVVKRSDAGQPLRMVGTMTDISKQKESEKVIQRSQKQFQTIFQTTPAGIVITTFERGEILDINESICEITGYTRQEAIGKTSIDIGFWSNPGDREEITSKLKTDGRFHNLEFDYHNKNGQRRTGLFSCEIVSLDHRPCIITTMVDISEKKRAEKALRSERDRAQMYLNTVEAIIVVLDRKGNITLINKKGCRILGYDESELMGRSWFHTCLPQPDGMQHVYPTFLKLKDGKIDDAEYFENDIITKNGEKRRIAWHNAILRDESGLFIGTLSSGEDISDKRFLREQLIKVQKMESIGNLAGGIAHDFNNILFPIVGLSELLLEDLPEDGPEYKNVQEILKAGKRGGDLVKQILTFSRQTEHEKRPIRIQNILREAFKLSRSTIPSDIEMSLDVQKDCGLVSADPTQLHQIAMNLITNAFHSVAQAGGQIFLQLKEDRLTAKDVEGRPLQPSRYALLKVSDTGQGIDPKIIDKIFEPYFTTKEKGKGTGLGLAVVYGIIKEHGGDVHVHSELGKGTTFSVYIPLMERSKEPDVAPKTELLQFGNERILVVDDEGPIAKLEAQMLERLGYRVSSRTSSLDALDAFRANPDGFDLVITDMTMPNMTGDQLARDIKAIRPHIPIIICTGFSERIDQEKAKSAGIKGFLMKPIVKTDLAKMVRDVLDESGIS